MSEKPLEAGPPLHKARYSIAWREFVAAFPTVAALAAVDGMLLLANVVMVYIGREHGNTTDVMPGMSHVLAYLSASSTIVALCLGVLCGAEEEENGTADFARRIPVPRLQIFREKMAGSLLAFLVWNVLAFALMILISHFAHGDNSRKLVSFMGDPYSFDYMRALILFTGGLAAGVWIGRVVVAAVVGGVGAVVLTNLAMIILYQMRRAHIDYYFLKTVNVWIYLGITALFLVLAAIRFQTREGR